ncbi:MAG: 4-hydroxythreonine-4-phosphate dehydrogenase PdxA [Candidatus Omnitrophica bacterium]|nr:4-hydroxythreonine-4-phosphate dehydrogenase PdxA [Candidatus Omnitrophota bacterium]
MLKSNKRALPSIAITMGDPRGIGPEVIRRALSKKSLLGQGRFIVIGNKKILGRVPSLVQVLEVPYETAGEGSLKFLDRAVALIKEKTVDALVTAPVSKEAVSLYHKGFVGHTEYLAQAFGVRRFDMMFIAPYVRLTILTRHVPLRNVPDLISVPVVFDSIILMAQTLKKRFRVRSPKIAVLGLNPHAGEGGLLGSEDIKYILPAIRKARACGINTIGPLPADTFFAFQTCPYDGIIAMYHDQGLAPLKAVYMKDLVNLTAGLPFVRTSPAHGTAFNIAGKNKADPSSMTAAIKLACELS